MASLLGFVAKASGVVGLRIRWLELPATGSSECVGDLRGEGSGAQNRRAGVRGASGLGSKASRHKPYTLNPPRRGLSPSSSKGV